MMIIDNGKIANTCMMYTFIFRRCVFRCLNTGDKREFGTNPVCLLTIKRALKSFTPEISSDFKSTISSLVM